MFGSLCVRGLIAREGILSLASLKRRQSVQKTFLCLYWSEDHTKSSVCENQRGRKRRMNRVSQLGVRPRRGQSGAEKQAVRSGVSDIAEVRSETPKWFVGSETPEYGVKTEQ